MRGPVILLVALAACLSGTRAVSELCTKKDVGQEMSGPGLRLKCLGTPLNRITSIKQLELHDIAAEITLL